MACKPRSFRRSSSGYAGCKTWTGYLQSTVEGLDDDGWVDGIGCRLWTENDRPLWATNLSWGYRCPSGVQAVTHCANHCHQNGWQVHSHEHPRSPGSVFGPFKRVFIGGAFQLINHRDYSDTAKPLVYRDDLPGGTRDYAGSSIRVYPKATIRGFARPHLDVVRGVFEGLFVDVNQDTWTPEEAVDFLNRFIVW